MDILSLDQFRLLERLGPKRERAYSDALDKVRYQSAVEVGLRDQLNSAEKEVQELRDNLHATMHQLRISAERGVALQAQVAETKEENERVKDGWRESLNELAKLRAALERIRAWDSAPYRLRAIAIAALEAQTQGERGAQILKRHDWLLGRLMAMNTVRLSQGLLSAEFLRLWELTLNEIAEQEATNV